MKNQILSLSLIVFLVSQITYAKPHPNKKANETFAATENNGTPTVVNADTPVEQNLIDEELDNNKPVSPKISDKNQIKPTSITANDSKPNQNSNEDDNEIFDVVPSSKIPEIAERVKYTYDILKRFGRAYDYRTTTLSELKKILNELENQTSKELSKNKS